MNQQQLQAKLKNENLTLVADINETCYISQLKGIAPILNPMKEDLHFFQGAIVVDKVIGKATAMLLVLSGVKSIYAYLLSQKAKEVLDYYQINYEYEKIVDYIMNRDQSGMCPMEQTVYDIDDLDDAYIALIEKQKELMK